jgi:hypothetical protein
MDAGEINHGLAGKGLVLIVSAQTPIPSEPSESAFHNPATWSDLKSFGFGRTTHNLESPTELLFDPGDDVFVSAISPNQLEATPAIVDTMLDALEQSCQNKFTAIAIWDTRSMDNNEQ